MISLDGHHRCSAVCPIKTEGEHEWIERSLHVTKVLHRDSQPVGQVEAFNLSRMRNTFSPIVRMDRLFLSAMEAVLNYKGTSGLQNGISFAETGINDTVDDVVTRRYLPKPLRSSYIHYVRYHRLITKNAGVLPMLASLNDCGDIASGQGGGACC